MDDNKKSTSFQRFWKACGVNLLIGLAITLAICGFVGVKGIFMPLPLWLALGLVCWLIRLRLVYRHWLQDGGGEQLDEDQEKS